MHKINILVTGAAGFIGFHLCRKLVKNKNYNVLGIDNINNYYSQKLKKDRIKILNKDKNFYFKKVDVSRLNELKKFFKKRKIDLIFNFAAQAGVRYSLKNPESYIQSNLRGFLNILELAKDKKIRTIYASSSSIYGDQKKFPIKENFIGIQKNLYASTKNINEELAKIYNKSFDIPIMGLRFFTVYGEWGRPDMLYLKYLNAIKKNKTIYLYNFGKHARDFTYISDVIEILVKLVKIKDKKYYQNNIFNICSGKPINLITYLKFIDKIYGKNCKIKKIMKQKIEIIKTHGSNAKIKKLVKKKKFVDYKEGLRNTVNWFKSYYF
tara:strand:+ start:32703 stop:33671 length:969 start_codon:yes stop_codon:yes gene_type:complete